MSFIGIFRFASLLVVAALSAATAQAQLAAHETTAGEPGQDFRIEAASVTREYRESRKLRISDFSGKPVPRYASLKYDEVNGRAGPGTDYPKKWVYRRQGLPVMVIRESRDWAKIRDPQGDEAWVHQRLLAARRTGITASALLLSQRPFPDAPPVAQVAMGVVIDIADCEGDWCRAAINGYRGWAPRDSVWGADDLD